MHTDSSEWVNAAKVNAAVDANNLLHYDDKLDSHLVLAVAANHHNIDAGVVKGFVKQVERRLNWRLANNPID